MYGEILRLSVQKVFMTKRGVSRLIDATLSLLGIHENFIIIRSSCRTFAISSKLKPEQVFSNLMTNSVKYHYKNLGTITINCAEI